MDGGKMKRIGDYFTAAILIILGLQCIFHPVYYSPFRARYIDLTGFNVPLGLGFVIIGIVFLWPKSKK
jgi:hypothetical protein